MQWCLVQRLAHSRCCTRLEHSLRYLLSHHRQNVRRDLRCRAHLAKQSVIFSETTSSVRWLRKKKHDAAWAGFVRWDSEQPSVLGYCLHPGLLPFPEADYLLKSPIVP